MKTNPAEVRFDPRGLLGALQHRHVSFVVVGAFARVVQGTDEVTRSLDITPWMRAATIKSLELALADLHAERADGKPLDLSTEEQVFELMTDFGELKIVPRPAGTRGYEDIRRAATHEHLGKGIRAQIASVGDLIRMGNALGRQNERDLAALRQLRQIPELQRELGIGIEP